MGGLYGVVLGRMPHDESIFAHRTDASKITLAALCTLLDGQGVTTIDCQQEAEHLASLGGIPTPCAVFLVHVQEAANAPAIVSWHLGKSVLRR